MPGEDPPVEQVLLDDAAGVVAECADVDEAEDWASSAQTLFRPVGPGGSRVMDASKALAAAEACPDGGAAAMVAASISVYGPARDRRRAARLVEQLGASGEPLPGWIGALGDVTPCRAALLTDSWEDERSVWIDFERSDGEVRGLGVGVNGSQGSLACHFVYGPPIEAIEGPFLQQTHAVLRPLDLADARVMVEAALERRDHTDLGYDGDDGQDHELRALVAQRVALLPDGERGPRDRSPKRRSTASAKSSSTCPRRPCPTRPSRWPARCAGSPMRGPTAIRCAGARAEWSISCVCGSSQVGVRRRVARHRRVGVPHVASLRRAAPRSRSRAARSEPRNGRESFVDMRRNAADPAIRSPTTNLVTEMLADGIDLSDEAMVQEWIDRYNARPRRERW